METSVGFRRLLCWTGPAWKVLLDIIPRGRVRAFTELFLSARTHGRFPDAAEAVPESSVWLRWFCLVPLGFRGFWIYGDDSRFWV